MTIILKSVKHEHAHASEPILQCFHVITSTWGSLCITPRPSAVAGLRPNGPMAIGGSTRLPEDVLACPALWHVTAPGTCGPRRAAASGRSSSPAHSAAAAAGAAAPPAHVPRARPPGGAPSGHRGTRRSETWASAWQPALALPANAWGRHIMTDLTSVISHAGFGYCSTTLKITDWVW